MTVGERIRIYRKRNGLTQRELAEITGLAVGTIQQYELNKRQPRIEMLKTIAQLLGCTVNDLVYDEEE